MKINTINGAILIEPETEVEQSFLCLWEAEVDRQLENEGASIDVIGSLLSVSQELPEGQK